MKWMSSIKTLLIAAVAAMSFSQPARGDQLSDGEKFGIGVGAALFMLLIATQSGGNKHRSTDPGYKPAEPREKAWPTKQRMDGYAFYYKKPLEKSGRTCGGIGGTLWTVYSWDGDKQERRFHCYVGNDRPDALETYDDGRFLRTYNGEMWLDARTNTWKYGSPQIGRDRDRDDHRTWDRDRDDRRWDRDRDRDDRRGVAGLTIRTGKRGVEYYSLSDLRRAGKSCGDVGGREKQITLEDNSQARVCKL